MTDTGSPKAEAAASITTLQDETSALSLGAAATKHDEAVAPYQKGAAAAAANGSPRVTGADELEAEEAPAAAGKSKAARTSSTGSAAAAAALDSSSTRKSGDLGAAAHKSGDLGEALKSGDLGAQKSGDLGVQKSGDLGKQKSADLGKQKSADLGAQKSVDLGAQKSGDLSSPGMSRKSSDAAGAASSEAAAGSLSRKQSGHSAATPAPATPGTTTTGSMSRSNSSASGSGAAAAAVPPKRTSSSASAGVSEERKPSGSLPDDLPEGAAAPKVKALRDQLSQNGTVILSGGVAQPVSPEPKPEAGPDRRISEHDKINTTNAIELLRSGSFKLKPGTDTVPYEQLKTLRLEDGIDVSRKEEYLTAEEFATVFKMERAAYLKLPAWKRLQLKKSTLLF